MFIDGFLFRDLSLNHLSGNVPDFSMTSYLEDLNLKGNNLVGVSGTLPTNLRSVYVFFSIDIRPESLSFPPEICLTIVSGQTFPSICKTGPTTQCWKDCTLNIFFKKF